MASYQLDFENRIIDGKTVFDTIELFRSSIERQQFIQNKSYYEGENWTIMHLPNRTYFSDRICKDANGNIIYDENNRPIRKNILIENPFVSNNRIPYGIFHDIVSQKVNTLFHETPRIESEEIELSNDFQEQNGYAMINAGIEASICGKSYIYENSNGDVSVFETENCIPFWDDETGELRALIRFIQREGAFSKKKVMIAEVYTENGLIKYKRHGASISKIGDIVAYKFIRNKSAILDEVHNISLSKLPIAVFKNNDKCTSDLTPSIRAKIDIIDLVQSGFINNIEDFSDVFWVIKNQAQGSMDEDDYADFLANINKTKRLFAEDATPEQFQIPHEARLKAIEMLELQIVKESGVIDTEKLTSTQLTTTAIKASTLKLEQKVSDFEWYANETYRQILNIYQEYNNINFDFVVRFVKLIINNDTEIIDNIIKIRSDISQETVLKLLNKIGYIDNIEDELERIKKEKENAISLLNLGDMIDVGGDTQANGQNVETT